MFLKSAYVLLYVLTVLTFQTHSNEEKTRHLYSEEDLQEDSHARWDHWTEWSTCSVECGNGVMNRSRDCRSMLDGSHVDGCLGKEEEVKLCSAGPCPTGVRTRSEEICHELHTRSFGGRRFRWHPYIHPVNKCELACQASGQGFYLGMSKNLADGTSCSKTENMVCLRGVCKSYGCDKILDSNAIVDVCGVCGGDNSSCSIVSKTVTKTFQPYTYQTIGTIPPGARNINITELRHSRNYLALKAVDSSFRLNTGFRLSRWGKHKGAGTTFKYQHRKYTQNCPGECIHADGPTDSTVEISVLFYTSNPGVSFSYTIPLNSTFKLDQDSDEYIDYSTRNGQKRPIYSSDFTFKRKADTNVVVVDKDISSQRSSLLSPTSATSVASSHNTGTVTKDSFEASEPTVNTVTVEGSGTDSSIEDAVIVIGDEVTLATTVVVEEDKPIDIKVADRTEAANKSQNAVKGDYNGNYQNEPMHSGLDNEIDPDVADLYAEKDTESESKKVGPENEIEHRTENEIETTRDRTTYDPDKFRRSPYSWRVMGYRQCSVTCGEGKQTPIIECIATNKDIAVEEDYCADIPSPSVQVVTCNYGACPPSWKSEVWTKCSVTCGIGSQSRRFNCVDPSGAIVSSSLCTGSQPEVETRSCDTGSCESGWYFTAWPAQCPVSCGTGTMSRNVHCVGGSCSASTKPEVEQDCNGERACGAVWFTGPWGDCNATCGLAYQSRAVLCVRKHHRGGGMTVVTENHCNREKKPSTYMSCDLDPCPPEWYMNEWSECSVTCGYGRRTRHVKCLDHSKQASSDCDEAEKPQEAEACNDRTCPPSDQTDRRPTRPEDKDCRDTFRQCSLVMQARLCRYKYYQDFCCKSCYGFEDD